METQLLARTYCEVGDRRRAGLNCWSPLDVGGEVLSHRVLVQELHCRAQRTKLEWFPQKDAALREHRQLAKAVQQKVCRRTKLLLCREIVEL